MTGHQEESLVNRVNLLKAQAKIWEGRNARSIMLGGLCFVYAGLSIGYETSRAVNSVINNKPMNSFEAITMAASGLFGLSMGIYAIIRAANSGHKADELTERIAEIEPYKISQP